MNLFSSVFQKLKGQCGLMFTNQAKEDVVR